MRIASMTLGAAFLVSAFLQGATPGPIDAPPSTTVAQNDNAQSPVVTHDSASVFEKAFWRRMQSDDKILHAERREWHDEQGNLLRWQWFIAFKPAPNTLAWLATNPFLLPSAQTGETAIAPNDPPPWFPSTWTGYIVQQNAAGQHSIAFSPEELCYATDAGGGFLNEP